jgi:hypothetical protein
MYREMIDYNWQIFDHEALVDWTSVPYCNGIEDLKNNTNRKRPRNSKVFDPLLMMSRVLSDSEVRSVGYLGWFFFFFFFEYKYVRLVISRYQTQRSLYPAQNPKHTPNYLRLPKTPSPCLPPPQTPLR